MKRAVSSIVVAIILLIATLALGYTLARCMTAPPAQLVPVAPDAAPVTYGCVYDRPLLAKIASSLVEAGYEGRIAELVTGYGTVVIDCQLELIDASVTAGMASGAAPLTPIEAHAKAILAAHKKGP